MAYRRCLSIRASLLARRSNPSFCYISHEDDRGKPEEYRPLRSAIDSYVSQRRSFRSYVKSSSRRYTGVSFGVGSGLVGGGLCKNRYMSTSMETAADELKKFVISDYPVLDVFIPAADAVKYFIDAVHSFTGLNWWSSIAITTLLIRGFTIPFLIYEAKSLKKFECTETLAALLYTEVLRGLHTMKDMEPKSREEMMKRFVSIHDLYRVALYEAFGNILKGMAIRGPVFVSFFLALTIMADEVPSFKGGGAFWFTDLTTPDYTFVLPSLTALSFLASRRSFWREKFTRSNHAVFRERNYVLAFGNISSGGRLHFAFYCYQTAFFPQVLSNPDVRKALGFPELPEPIPSFFSSNIGKENWPSFYKR